MASLFTRSLAIFLLLPFLSLGQQANQKPNLTGRTFRIVMDGERGENGTGVDMLFLFRANQVAVFRMKSGHQVLDNAMQWRMKGDSLWLQVKPASLEVDGKIDSIEMAPDTYALIQTAYGYLLRRNDEQLRLVEQK